MTTMFRSFINEDSFNLLNHRNTKNTNKRRYNCAGYALGTYSWYCPHTENEDGWDGFDYGFDSREEAWNKTVQAVARMMIDFHGRLRVIQNVQDANRGEYVIAFRLSADGDFHYIKRAHNHHWFHKRGASAPIHRISEYEVLNTNWCNRYDGPIILMAMQKRA